MLIWHLHLEEKNHSLPPHHLPLPYGPIFTLLVILYMVNVLKFKKNWTPFCLCFQIKCMLSGLVFTKCLSEYIANREYPDLTVSSEALWSGSALFVYPVLTGKKSSKFWTSIIVFFQSNIILHVTGWQPRNKIIPLPEAVWSGSVLFV